MTFSPPYTSSHSSYEGGRPPEMKQRQQGGSAANVIAFLQISAARGNRGAVLPTRHRAPLLRSPASLSN